MKDTSSPEDPRGSQPGNDAPPCCAPASNIPPSALPIPHSAFPTPPSTVFPRSPGETPRAYSAFMTWFQLGHARSHQAVADKLDESLNTVKKWASKYNWSERLLAFTSGLLQQQTETLAAHHRQAAADWARRLEGFREQEWDAAQKLLRAAQCFLESFGEDDLRKMTLAQVSRALKISSTIGRLALAGAELPESSDPALSPVQQQLLAALQRVYGQSPPSPPPPPSSSPSSTSVS